MSKKEDLLFVGERTLKIMNWIKFQPMKDWFESNIILNKGAVRGAFTVDTAPHLKRVFEELDKSHVNVVTMKVASQTQKTSTALGAIMKWIDTDYHDLFIMLPRANDIKKFLEFKIKPFIDGALSVKNKMKDYRQEEKERKHSHFYLTAQNLFAVISINDTKSITTKYGVFDEISEFPAGIINEAMERMKEYGTDYKALLTSTQIHKNDEVNHFFDISEVKIRYFLKCCHCEEFFYPLPEHLKFKTVEEFKKENNIDEKEDIPYTKLMSDYKPDASRGAYLECPHCLSRITNKQRVDTILSKQCEWFQIEITQQNENDSTWEIVKKPKDYYESIGIDLNTALAPRVPLKKFAEKEIECRYSDPHMRDTLYQKFYVGWWNILYTPKSTNKTIKSDILLLSNGVDNQIVPNNIHTLHLGVDLQKDRLYYTVCGIEYAEDIVLHIIEYGELYSNGEGHDLRDLTELIEDNWKDEKGKEYKITSVGCDIRGFSQIDPKSRSNEILNFIFDYAIRLREEGVVEWDNFIHPMYGVPKFNNKVHEGQGFQEVKTKRKMMIEEDEEEIEIRGIAFSNMKIKTMLFSMINRGIENKKDNKNYNRQLLYISEDVVRQAEERDKLPYHERMGKHSLEAHLTSEHLTYAIKNGKPAREQTYEKKYNGVRNDWLDCTCMCIAQALKHDTYRTEKPNIEVVNTDDINLKGFFS